MSLSSHSTPRVNFELMERYQGKRVLLVGYVDDGDIGGKAKIKTCDGAHVTVELLDGNTAFTTPFVEFQGLVTSATTLREESRTDFGAKFDMGTYNELCKLSTMDYANIFS